MRTLILIFLCALCATVAVLECHNRRNGRAVVAHAVIGAFIGWIIFKLIVHAGLFDSYR
ncbi:MAG: hypothetical protein JNK23_13595 [Opitutaceae bacterium]|nr:hypothetical protein [Opitutaceae bacterium]